MTPKSFAEVTGFSVVPRKDILNWGSVVACLATVWFQGRGVLFYLGL